MRVGPFNIIQGDRKRVDIIEAVPKTDLERYKFGIFKLMGLLGCNDILTDDDKPKQPILAWIYDNEPDLVKSLGFTLIRGHDLEFSDESGKKVKLLPIISVDGIGAYISQPPDGIRAFSRRVNTFIDELELKLSEAGFQQVWLNARPSPLPEFSQYLRTECNRILSTPRRGPN